MLIPIQRICVSIRLEREHRNERQVAEEKEPAHDRREGEDEVDDHDDGEEQRRLPRMEPGRASYCQYIINARISTNVPYRT